MLREDFKPAKEALDKKGALEKGAHEKGAHEKGAEEGAEVGAEVATPPPSAPRARRASATPSPPRRSDDDQPESAAAASRARLAADANKTKKNDVEMKKTMKKKAREDVRDYFPRASKRARVVA